MALTNQTDWQVEIMGVDVSGDVEDIASLSTSLDSPELTEYTVSELTINLFNHNYDYSPDKPDNFFTQQASEQMIKQSSSGFRAPVVVKARLREERATLQTIFSGRIIEVNHTVKPGTFQVVAVDRRVDLQNNPLTNFGLAKNNKIARVVRRGARGQHIFADSVIPISTGSVSGATLDGMKMKQKQTLRDEGQLNALNFTVDEDGTGIETEAVTGDNVNINLNYKAPFRGITIERAIREILARYNIAPNNIDIPIVQNRQLDDNGNVIYPALWNSRGRPGYELESVQGSCPNDYEFQWRGQITDYLHRPTNTGHEFFFLYSHRNAPIMPALFRYRTSDGSWTKLYEASTHQEWWRLASTNFQTFYILRSASRYEQGLPLFGTYNPALSASVTDTDCLKLDLTFNDSGAVTGANRTTMLTTAGLRPQLSMHYWYGFRNTLPRGFKTNSNYGYLPDTRHGFQIAGNALWYRFANTTQFGLARGTLDGGPTSRLRRDGQNQRAEAVITINRDTFQNEASFDFTIADGKIYGSHTNMERVGTEIHSKLLVYQRNMPTQL